ncbi:MAG: hypothetical protein ACLQQ4_09745 [Bacteroidia bacterium]
MKMEKSKLPSNVLKMNKAQLVELLNTLIQANRFTIEFKENGIKIGDINIIKSKRDETIKKIRELVEKRKL